MDTHSNGAYYDASTPRAAPPYPMSDAFPPSRHSSTDSGDHRVPFQQQPPEAPREYPSAPPPQPRATYHDAISNTLDQASLPGVDANLVAQITQNVISQLRNANDAAAAGTPTTAVPRMPNHTSHDRAPSTGSRREDAPLREPVPLSPNQSRTSPPAAGRDAGPPMSPSKFTERGRPEPADTREEERLTRSPVSSASDEASPTLASEKRAKPTREPTYVGGITDPTTLEKIWGALFDAAGQPTARLGQFFRGLATHLIEDWEPKHSLVVTPNKMVEYYAKVRIPKETYPWADVFDDSSSYISRLYRALNIQHHLVQEAEHLDERPDIPGLTPIGFARWMTLMIQAHPDAEFERMKKTALEMPISNPDDRKERFAKDISRRLFPATADLRVRESLVRSIEEHAQLSIDPNHEYLPPQSTHAKTFPVEAESRHNSLPEIDHRDFDRRVSSHTRHQSIDSEAGYFERKRQPYGGGPRPREDSPLRRSVPPPQPTVEEEDPSAPPTPLHQPIERERKPYAAAPGGGKVFNHHNNPVPAARTAPAPPNLPNGSNPQAPSCPPPAHAHAHAPPPQGPPPPGSSVHRASSGSRNPMHHHHPPPPPPAGMPPPHASTANINVHPAGGAPHPPPPEIHQHPPHSHAHAAHAAHRGSTGAPPPGRPRAPTAGAMAAPARTHSPASSAGGTSSTGGPPEYERREPVELRPSAAGERYTPGPPPMGGGGPGGGGGGYADGYDDEARRPYGRDGELRRDGGAGAGGYRGGSPVRRYEVPAGGPPGRRASMGGAREREYMDEDYYRRRPEERRW